MRRARMILLLVAATLPAPGSGRAQLKAAPGDWPGWLGPDRTGVSTETGLLKEWPEGGPPLLWKATGLGIGFSTPSIAGGRIYLLGTREGKEQAFALDARDGKEIWATEVGAIARNGPPSYPGPRSTPTDDGDRIYVLGSDGNLLCLDRDGKVVWRKNLDRDFRGERGRWAYAESPLIDGDVLICTPGGDKATLVALNKKTGDLIWKAQVPAGGNAAAGGRGRGMMAKANQAAYASAIVVEVGGIRQYVQFLAGTLVGVAAKNGRLLWRFDKITSITNCMTPIFHDDCVFIAAAGRGPGPNSGGALVRLTAQDGGVTSKELWHNRDLANHHGGCVLVNGFLYGTNNSELVCVDFKTGGTKWKNRSVGKGSVTAADGRLYVRGEDGPVALVETTPDAYREKGRFTPPDRSGQKAWPHPVIAGGRLYLRDGDVLLCYDVKAK